MTTTFGLDLIYQDDGTDVRTMLADGLGSVRQELVGTEIGYVVTNDPFGGMLAMQGESGTTYGYTGEQVDSGSGLVYLRARYYDPSLKQFQSKDPFPGYARLPQSQNGLNYVGNNPINFTDPTGNDPHWCDSQSYPGVPSYAVQDAINECRANYYGTLQQQYVKQNAASLNAAPPAPVGPNFLEYGFYDYLPVAGSVTGIVRGHQVMDWYSSQPGFSYQNQIAGRWHVANCPMGCHLPVGTLESQYGSDIWRWKGQPRPATPLLDLWGEGLVEATYGWMGLVGDAVAVTEFACALKKLPTSVTLYDDLFSPRKQHILYGDGPNSGGHLWPGQPGKTPFPQNWDAERVLYETADIVTDPNTQWYAQTGNGGFYQRNGDPAVWRAWETRSGVTIRVVHEPATGRIITSFPNPNYTKFKGIPIPK